ncbi:MAG: hypothetical protein ACREFW_07240 [Rhizomicrobium sp.]
MKNPRARRANYLARIKEAERSAAQVEDPMARASLQRVVDGYQELIRRLDQSQHAVLESLPNPEP